MRNTIPKNPKVSIIVPVFNSEKTIEDCISSILNQNYKNFELVLVNNNSDDSTEEIIKDFLKKDKRIKYFFEPIRKRGRARYLGEINSTGDIILMTDSDCIVPKDWITSMIEPIIKEDYNAVQGFEESAKTDFISKMIQKESEERFKRKRKNNIIGCIDGKNFAITKTFLEKIGLTNKNYPIMIDNERSVKLSIHKAKVKFLHEIKVIHYHPDNNKELISKQFERAKWATVINKDYKKFLKNSEFLKETAQTPATFLRFFPEIFISIIRNGIKSTWYYSISGLSWRAGIVYGRIFMKKTTGESI